MFWKFNLMTSSHIDALLDKEGVTLRELMDEDDILQECKAQNRRLVDFLIQAENMQELVKLITIEPPDDIDEKLRFKYPNAACELLTSDVSQINDKLAGDVELVNRLYSFLEGDKPLNPLLASFFSKVMGLLITRKSEMVFDYLKSKSDFVGRLLYHIGTSAVMDLLLRLITCIESPETRRNVIEWLNGENIVEKLVDSIVVDQDEDIHCNAAQSLCDIVRLGREQLIQQHDSTEPDPLLHTMEQEETVAHLLSKMFDSGKNESVLVNGLCVIHTLLEVRRTGSDTSDQLPNGETDHFTQGINNVIAAIVPRLKDFHDLLLSPPQQRYSTMPTSVGYLDPPLGNTRLQVAKLMTALAAANMHQVNLELASLGTIRTLLDLYFKYEWNNFLHTQVEQCLHCILNNRSLDIDGKQHHPLLFQLFTEYNFIQRLLTEWEENEQQQKVANGRRRGFMGHLTRIANSISGLVEKGDPTSLVREYFNGLSQDVKDRWSAFVTGSLSDVNKKNAIELMRGHPMASSSEDDDTEFKDIPFPPDAMQQAFSDYQLQQMTSNFIDQFGFNDEEFAEQDEKIEAAFSDRISNIEAELQSSSINQTNTAFEQVCNERIQQFDNDDSDEDIWEEKAITFDKTARLDRMQANPVQCNSSEEDSTDSGEELDSPIRLVQQPTEGMDVDSTEELTSHAESAPMDTTSSPWEKPSNTDASPSQEAWADVVATPPDNEESWADFSNFQSLSNEGARCSSPVEVDNMESIKGNPQVVQANGDEGKGDSAVTVSATITLTGSNEVFVEDLEQEGSSMSQTQAQPFTLNPTLVENGNYLPAPDSLSTAQDGAETSLTSADVADPKLSNTSPEPTLSSPLPLSDQIHVGAVPDEPAASSSSPNTNVPDEPHESMPKILQDNLSFLASSGLMKTGGVVAASCSSSRPPSQPQDNGPLEPPALLPADAITPSAPLPASSNEDVADQESDSTQCTSTMAQKIEQARTQAREAQDLFDTATTTVGNGPV